MNYIGPDNPMNLKTCLLVTDDPDDHQAFSEALSEVSANTVLIVMLDSTKASMVLQAEKLKPDYIFVDLSMHGIFVNDFLKVVKSIPEARAVPSILYGEEEELNKIQEKERLPVFPKDYNYAELRDFLKGVIRV